MFTIAEVLILLGTDDDKGTAVSSASSSLNYGLVGSILSELAMKKHIVLKEGKVVLADDTLTDVSYFNTVLDEIKEDHKERTVEHWINHFAGNTKAINDPVYLSLVDKRILKEEDKTYFFFFNTNVYPTVDARPEQEIRKHVNDVVFNNAEADAEVAMLLSLIKTCDLTEEVFGKERKKSAEKKLIEIIETNEYGKAVSQSVKDMETAILMATTTVLTTTVIMNNN
ncbi:GOLPH3/VPS74 family protein [Jeotgalicoccus psychrophilus]|uniref:GOLPH3/VPS74 family protein n=1 Tax=Jeotgalicoccus psychrophilus TaxID=157228 RepID=UPI0004198307|nr:GPP34 family phosphoprotein [Jeotgalicoccus psychrophilus]